MFYLGLTYLGGNVLTTKNSFKYVSGVGERVKREREKNPYKGKERESVKERERERVSML